MGYRIEGSSNSSNKKIKNKVEKKTAKKKKPGIFLKILRVIFTLLLLLLVAFAGATEFLPKINKVEISKDDKKIEIIEKDEIKVSSEKVDEYIEKRESAINILLVGIDGMDYDNARSDVMIILSINKNTKNIKLISISRDTFSYIPKVDRFEKLNHSFNHGGAEETLKSINRNYDLNIRDYVVFNYEALASTIDYLGGFPTYITSDESYDMSKGDIYIEGDRDHVLTGEQSVLYARIRYNSGGDLGRNKRQRDIIKFIFNSAKNMGKKDLAKFADSILPLVRTTYGYSDIDSLVNLYSSIKEGATFEDGQFPFFSSEITLSDGLFYFVPKDLEANIKELHRKLFNFEGYAISDKAREINNEIINRTGVTGE